MSHVFNSIESQVFTRGDGIDTRISTRAATTAAIDLSANLNGATIDGVALSVNDRILVKNQSAVAEVTTIDTTGATAGGLSGKYFCLNSASGNTYYVWFDVDNGSVDPVVSGKTALEVDISAGDSATNIATKLRAAINGNVDFVGGGSGMSVTATDNTTGPVDDAVDGNSGLSISTTTAGTSSIDHGIWVVGNGVNATFRAEDLLDGDNASFIFVDVQEGTVNAKSQWTCTSLKNASLVGTHALTWTQNQVFNYAKGAVFYATSSTELAALTAPSQTSLLQIDGSSNVSWVDRGDIASGLDPKESVRVSTRDSQDIGGTYNSAGGTGGKGSFAGVDLTSNTIFDLDGGATTLVIGDRLLIRSQTDKKENGIYVVTTAGAAGVIERAGDHDESVAGNVSAGNFTFVETGDTLDGTQWYLQGDGVLTLNTNNLNWALFGAATSYAAGDGIDISLGSVSVDLKSQGGLIIESTELAVDLSATNITGTLSVVDGGTGLTSLASGSLLVGTGTNPMSALSAVDNRVLTSEGGTLAWRTRLHTLNIFGDSANRPEVMIFNSTSDAAVNELTVSNAITSNVPKLSATGGDTNINLGFLAKGTGTFDFCATSSTSAEIRLYEDTDDGSEYVGLKAPVLGVSQTYTLPIVDGSANDVLVTDGNGVMSWKSVTTTYRDSHSLQALEIKATSPTPAPVAYFSWRENEYNDITSAYLVYEVVKSDRDLYIELYDITNTTTIASVTHTAAGFFSLDVSGVTSIGGNARLAVRVNKSAAAGSNPQIFGLQLVFNPVDTPADN